MKRARGSGGRFLNTKQLQQQPRNASTRSTTNGTSSSGSTHLRLGGGTARDQTMLAPKAMPSQYNSKKAVSSAPGFTVTPMLHRDDTFFQHPSHHLSFSGHFGQASAQAGMHNGTQQRVPVMRWQLANLSWWSRILGVLSSSGVVSASQAIHPWLSLWCVRSYQMYDTVLWFAEPINKGLMVNTAIVELVCTCYNKLRRFMLIVVRYATQFALLSVKTVWCSISGTDYVFKTCLAACQKSL